jgi:hypothetical protein
MSFCSRRNDPAEARQVVPDRADRIAAVVRAGTAGLVGDSRVIRATSRSHLVAPGALRFRDRSPLPDLLLEAAVTVEVIGPRPGASLAGAVRPPPPLAGGATAYRGIGERP